MSNPVTIDLSGDEELLANIAVLVGKVQTKFLRKAMKDTMQPLEDSAKTHCTEDLGVLKGAIDTKITTAGSGTGGGLMVGIMGPRTGVKYFQAIKRGKRKGTQRARIPTNYGPKVEFGHKLVTHKGEVLGNVAPKPFMRPAWDEQGGEKALDRFLNSMDQQIQNA